MENTELKIQKTNAIEAYNQADENGKKLLQKLFGNQLNQKITDRIKTFEDALAIYPPSENIPILLSYNGVEECIKSAKSYLKLCIIAQALNEGWTPDWSNSNEYKYIPWFEHKDGFGLSYYAVVLWSAATIVGSRICYKTRELAEYAATQFADLYNDFLSIPTNNK